MYSTVLTVLCLVIIGHDLVYGAIKPSNETFTGTPPPVRKLGEKCRENSTLHFCTGQGVEVMCSPNDTCECKLGYEPDGSSGACKVKYRKLGESCRETGQTHFWYFCGGFGVEVVCPDSNKCQCKPGYEPDGTKGDCKIAAPKAECKTDADCTGAWTQCLKGKCTCLDGFQARDKIKGVICDPVPKGFNCPGGEKPLIDSKTKTVQLCQVDFSNNTCPTGSFCNYWPNSMAENHEFAGHCCPRAATTKTNGTVAALCPVGVAHKTGVCPDLRQNVSATSGNETNKCPLGTEYGCTVDGACCPRPCRSGPGFFNYQGECYDHVPLDSPCKISSQCFPGAECTGGTCQCKKGNKRNDAVCVMA